MATITALLKESMEEYRNSLTKWVPSQTDNDPKERNLTLYFAKSLLEAGYTVFQEVPSKSGKIRIDMVATKGNSCIIVEAKRFYDLDEVKVLNRDIKRVKLVRLSCVPGFRKMSKIGVILAQTYNENRRMFWEKRMHVGRVRNIEWGRLAKLLPEREGKRGVQQLYAWLDTGVKLWALWAIFDR